MPADQNNLAWIDMEMTGLQPDADRIIEIAMLVTDPQLAIVATGPVLVVHQPDAVLEAMDSWNQSTHKKTGLIDRVRASTMDEAAAERAALEFLGTHVPVSASPMCGNSICQDRRFLARWMPKLESHFHYRNLDVSTLKERSSAGSPRRRGVARRQARGDGRHRRVDRGAEVLPQGGDEHLGRAAAR
jgi:oligoribonuclease